MARATGSLDNGRVSFAPGNLDNRTLEPDGDQRLVTDPVCGRTVHALDAAAASERQGRVFYFCSHACKEAFERRAVDADPWDGRTLEDKERDID